MTVSYPGDPLFEALKIHEKLVVEMMLSVAKGPDAVSEASQRVLDNRATVVQSAEPTL